MAEEKNKYLTFILGNETYGLPILKVREIIGMMSITHVPGMPEYVKGVINLRGKIIPVLDLRLKFNFESIEYDDRTCIIIVEINREGKSQLSGLVVDTVWEVLDIDKDNIEPPPYSGNDNEFLHGIGKAKDKVIMILNTDKIIIKQDTNKILALNKSVEVQN